MKNVLFAITLPTTREGGGALLPEDIASFDLQLSADGGATFTPVGTFTPDVVSVPVNDLPFSDQYVVRGWVTDTLAQSGVVTDVPFSVVDTSAPGPLTIDVSFP